MNNAYALANYGFDTETTVTTFPEERRQWRVKIEKHVSTESQMTRDHVDDRVDNTIEPHLDTIQSEVEDVKDYLVNTVVNTYLVPVKANVASIKDTVEQTNSYVRGTLTSYVDQVEGYTDTLEGSQSSQNATLSEQNTILTNIWNKVRYLPTSW